MGESALTEAQQGALEQFNALPVWPQARMVRLDSLEFTDWNVNVMTDSEFDELVSEIDEGGYTTDDGVYVPGFDEPVSLLPLPAGKWLVPSGEHRVRAALALKMEAIPAVLKVHLTGADEAEIKMWTVKRNNIRGRPNATKYAALEHSLSERHKIRAEVARERMMVKGDLLRNLRKNRSVLNNEPGGGPPSRGGKGSGSGVEPGAAPSASAAPAPPATDGERQTKKDDAARQSLQRSFKAAWEEALVSSAHTVEHGYLVLAGGKDGKCHVVVDTDAELATLTKRMVASCSKESAKIGEFLRSAITTELNTWEER